MKKFTNLLIVGSLALAGALMAQQPTPEESQPPGKKPKKEQPAVTKPETPRAPKTEAPAVKEPAVKEPTLNQAPAMTPAMTKPETKPEMKGPKNKKNAPPTAPTTNAEQPATTAPVTSATPDLTKKESRRNNKNSKTPATDANANASPSASAAAPKTKATASPAAAKTTTTPAPTVATTPATTPAAATTPVTTPAPTVAATMTPAAAASTTPAAGATMTPAPMTAPSASTSTTTTNTATTKKIEPAKVQEIKQQHTSFRAQPKPQVAPSVQFSAGFRLPGVEMWTGPQYEVYRSYRPERHDRGYYSSRYQRVELVAGGYYYFNNGYWYPAWGYDPGHEYYAYDTPIYVGKRAVPPDQVIADVQAALKEMGYYRGEVDGLIGPLTREALTGYQRDNGMTVTAVIDEPTLDSLGMSS